MIPAAAGRKGEPDLNDIAVQFRHVSMAFPGVLANDDVSLDIRKGEVFALVGENGAGKSTLMNILYGIHTPTGGSVSIRGEEVSRFSPRNAIDHGVGMVHQHFMLVPSFTVAQNIVMSREPRRLGVLFDNKAAEAAAQKLVEEYGLVVDPAAVVREIGVGLQQRVEILKTLYRGADILILDEPTAVLTPQETDELFAVIRRVVREIGMTVIIITHKLYEVMAISDRVGVMRKGRLIGVENTCDVDEKKLASMMVGRPVQLVVDKTPAKPGEPVLEIENLTVPSQLHKNDAVKGVSFTARRGEIVCIAGIDGNGQSELVYALTGLEKASGGKITLLGKDITHASIRQRSFAGMSHIPEDRHKHGLVLDYTLEQNLVLQRYYEPQFQHGGFIRFDEVRKYADKLIEEYDIRSGQGPVTIARSMSGGNQQKAIVAREIDRELPLIVAVQPTRGLDVGAIEYIHKQLVAQRDDGKAVLLVSLELDEVMNLSDRILVMYEGEIVGEFDPKKVTVEELGLYMAGAKRQNGEEKK